MSGCGPFEGPSSYHWLCRWSLISRRNGSRTSLLLGALPGFLGRWIDVLQARQAVRAPATLPFLYLDVTRNCNSHCGMCGYASHYPSRGQELSTASLLRLVDEAAELGTMVVSVGGGEPFTRPDILDVLARVSQRGMAAVVHSNGSLLDRGLCERISQLRRLVLVLSLDSHSRNTHDRMRGLPCFDASLSAARFFRDNAPHVKVIYGFTISARNYRNIAAAAHAVQDTGGIGIRFTPFHGNLQHRFKPAAEIEEWKLRAEHLPAVRDGIEEVIALARRNGIFTNSEEFLRLIAASQQGPVPHRCCAGFLFCSVDPYGNLFPCYDHQGLLDVRETGLAEAFRSEEMDRLRGKVAVCDHRCWNIGNAEPSLRLDPRFAGRHPGRLLREAFLFLDPAAAVGRLPPFRAARET